MPRRIRAAWRIALLAAAAGGVAAESRVEVRVTADRVNLRAGPGFDREVVHQASAGDVLVARDFDRDSEWVNIVPPDGAEVWVYAELVEAGVVAASRVYVRSGPGISYRPVGRVDKGVQVVVRERSGDWLRIAPPEGCSLWIHGDYVVPVVTPEAEREAPSKPVRPPAAPERVSRPRVSSPSPMPKPARAVPEPASVRAPATPAGPRAKDTIRPQPPLSPDVLLRGKPLVSSVPQGRPVRYAGVVSRAGLVWRRPSGYCLVGRDRRGRDVTLCYVMADSGDLLRLLGRTVRVEGVQYWLQGVRLPAVVVRKIRVGRSDVGGTE